MVRGCGGCVEGEWRVCVLKVWRVCEGVWRAGTWINRGRRGTRYREFGRRDCDIGKMTAITAINGIQKNIFKNCTLAFLAVFP